MNTKGTRMLMTALAVVAVVLVLLFRPGREPLPGVLIEETEAYSLYENGSLYILRLYGADGALLREESALSARPVLAEEDGGLWSVTLGTEGAGRCVYFFSPADGCLSGTQYDVLDARGGLLARIGADGRSLIVQSIFDEEPFWELRDFAEPLTDTAKPFLSAALDDDGTSLTVSYRSGEDEHTVSETISLT